MALTVLQINHDRASDFIASDSPDKSLLLTRLRTFILGLASGALIGTSILRATTAVKATGTATLSSTIATDTFSINGVAFTAVASGATGNQFNVGANDTETAANLAAAINASATALVSKHVTATSALGVVTLTAIAAGHSGNAITMAQTGGTITCAARLTGGTSDAPVSTTL